MPYSAAERVALHLMDGIDGAEDAVLNIRRDTLNRLFIRLYEQRGEHEGSPALLYALETVQGMLRETDDDERNEQ